jgi:hypothetical protein
MASGGIVISGMEFIAYRVIDMEIKTLPTFGMLFTEITFDSEWDFGLGFSNITFEPDAGIYVVPLSARMNLLQTGDLEKRSREDPYISVNATISGAFRFTEKSIMDNELREKMIRQQAPAIILPYLRATIGTMLVSAGFGGVTIPLINMYETAKQREHVKIIHTDKDGAVAFKKKQVAKNKK